ncbi:MAG: TIGR02186 family protein [Candidatus Bipolaricaulota bacterium]
MDALILGLLLAGGPAFGNLPQGVPGPGDSLVDTDLVVEPSEVRAGMFFDGATVRISALVPEGLAITVSCVGAEEPVVLNRKGKVLGLIWMNVGEVEIDGAPNLYLLNATGLLGEMAMTASLEALGVGYGPLQRRALLKGGEGEDALLFGEFLSLKESDGLYGVSEEAIETEPEGQGMVRVATDIRLPAKARPGEYRIQVHGFSPDAGYLLGTARVRITQVGVAASISTLATEHGLLYGILAVVVAIAVGLFTGVVFGLGSKKAH